MHLKSINCPQCYLPGPVIDYLNVLLRNTGQYLNADRTLSVIFHWFSHPAGNGQRHKQDSFFKPQLPNLRTCSQ